MNLLKSITVICLSVTLVVCIFTTLPIFANSTNGIEAVELPFNESVSGEISTVGDKDYFKFTLNKASSLGISVEYDKNNTAKMEGYIYSYDLRNCYDYSVLSPKDGGDIGGILEPGTYYCMITANTNCQYIISGRKYELGNNEIEPNNNFFEAEVLKRNVVKRGYITDNDRIDVYKFTLKKQRKVKLNLTNINIGAPLKYDIYEERNASYGKYYDLLKRNHNWYSQSEQYEWFDFEDSDYFNDVFGFEGRDYILLDKGTYYLVIEPTKIDISDRYLIKFETSAPTPVFKKNYGDYAMNVKKISAKVGKRQIRAEVVGGKVKKFYSSNKKIMAVNSKSGCIRGKKKGTAYLKAKMTNGKVIKCKVVVK